MAQAHDYELRRDENKASATAPVYFKLIPGLSPLAKDAEKINSCQHIITNTAIKPAILMVLEPSLKEKDDRLG